MAANRFRALILFLTFFSIVIRVDNVSGKFAAQTEVDINDVVTTIENWKNGLFSGYKFKDWVSVGDMGKFRTRLADGDVQAYIDKPFLDKLEANAAYVDSDVMSGYFNDLVLAGPPNTVNPQTLWHEGMHAIFDAHDSDLLVSSDEIYTWYMENVISIPLTQSLEAYEKEYNKGKDCNQEKLDKQWEMFEKRMEEAKTTGYGKISSQAQLDQLYNLTGFRVDVAAIRQKYVAARMDKCPTGTVVPEVSGDLDLIFCIDVTGSMEDDITEVKSSASSIVNSVAAKSSNYRIAVLAYRDWNDSMGLPTFEDYKFSSDKNTIINNINSLSVGGGDDTPEAVFEALLRAIDSKSLGGWRSGANKQIILMGDAPPHDPGKDGVTAETVSKAAYDADPAVIQTIVIGIEGSIDPDAEKYFKLLASSTGGGFYQAANAEQVVDAIQKTISEMNAPKAVPNWFFGGSIAVICIVTLGAVGIILLIALVTRRRSPRPVMYPMPYPPPVVPPTAPPYMPPQAIYPPPQPGYPAPQQAYPPPVQPYYPPAPATVIDMGPGGSATLYVQRGMQMGQRFALKQITRIGREAGNDILLQNPRVSRQQAVIHFNGSIYILTNQSSSSMTQVNGVPASQPVPLRRGDVINMGGEELVFEG